MKKLSCFLLLLGGLALLAGCAPEPRPLAYGEDQCNYCKMTLSDPKFGGELVTAKGLVRTFDAIECMIPYLEEHPEEYAYVLVTPYDQPQTLLARDSVTLVRASALNSPMGAHVAAFSSRQAADTFLRSQEGSEVAWSEALPEER